MMPMTLFTQWLETISFFYNVSGSQGFNSARKKIITRNHLILKRKKVKFHIYESSLSAWKFTDQWNLTLQVQGADYTPDLISSLLHGSLLHTDLLLDSPSPQPRCGWAVALLKCWITRWKLPVRVPLTGQASWCWKHSCSVISQVLMLWVAHLQDLCPNSCQRAKLILWHNWSALHTRAPDPPQSVAKSSSSLLPSSLSFNSLKLINILINVPKSIILIKPGGSWRVAIQHSPFIIPTVYFPIDRTVWFYDRLRMKLQHSTHLSALEICCVIITILRAFCLHFLLVWML